VASRADGMARPPSDTHRKKPTQERGGARGEKLLQSQNEAGSEWGMRLGTSGGPKEISIDGSFESAVERVELSQIQHPIAPTSPSLSQWSPSAEEDAWQEPWSAAWPHPANPWGPARRNADASQAKIRTILGTT
jgi:hypothetical protein